MEEKNNDVYSVIASRPPERRQHGTRHARANFPLGGGGQRGQISH